MRSGRVIVLVVLLAFVAVPAAMASDGCAGMSTLCIAPCSAPCIAASAPASDHILTLIAETVAPPLTSAPVLAANAPDPPPKSPLL